MQPKQRAPTTTKVSDHAAAEEIEQHNKQEEHKRQKETTQKEATYERCIGKLKSETSTENRSTRTTSQSTHKTEQEQRKEEPTVVLLCIQSHQQRNE